MPSDTRTSRDPARPRNRAAVLADHSPPYNLAVEQGCLGMMLRDPDCVHEVVETTRPEEFWRDIHQEIARVLWDQYGAGRPTDLFAVSEQLQQRKVHDQVGGDLYLSDLIESAPAAANAGYYAGIVHAKWKTRRLIEVANAIVHRGYANDADAEEQVNQAEAEIFALSDDRADSNLRSAGAAVAEAIQRIERRAEGVAGLSSGYPALDDYTDGWRPGQVVIIGARPSMGKTALALAFADFAAVELRAGVLLVSLEMSSLELGERLLVARSGVPNHKLRHVGSLGPRDYEAIGQAYDASRAATLTIDDTPARSPLKVMAAARRLKAKGQLDLIVVDYLQLVDPDDDGRGGRASSREEKVAAISRRFKTLARELDVPILLLSQLNRLVENREDRRPRMSDLRESGAIEQDADVVLLLHRPEYYDPNDQPGIAEVIVAKNRNGATGTAKLAWRRELATFASLAHHPDPDVAPVDAQPF